MFFCAACAARRGSCLLVYFCLSLDRTACALRSLRLFILCCFGRLRGGQGFLLARVFWLVTRLNGMRPAGTGAFLLCNLGRLRGGRQGGPVRGSIDAFWPLAQGVTFTLRMRRVISISLSASHAGRKRTLALRGAEGDRRAQRGSSRSRSRAALVE